MSSFPSLKSGAIAQYPMDRVRRFSTEVLRFVDGSEQRFPRFRSELKRWVINLSLLDEDELERVREFFAEQRGSFDVFSFTDPWDSVVYPSCRFDQSSLSLRFEDWARGATELVIVENR